MTLKIEMELDNAAFEEGGAEEIQRILDCMASRLPEPLQTTSEVGLRDINGNRVGTAKIE